MCPIHNKPGEPAMLVLCAPPTSLLGERKRRSTTMAKAKDSRSHAYMVTTP